MLLSSITMHRNTICRVCETDLLFYIIYYLNFLNKTLNFIWTNIFENINATVDWLLFAMFLFSLLFATETTREFKNCFSRLKRIQNNCGYLQRYIRKQWMPQETNIKRRENIILTTKSKHFAESKITQITVSNSKLKTLHFFQIDVLK